MHDYPTNEDVPDDIGTEFKPTSIAVHLERFHKRVEAHITKTDIASGMYRSEQHRNM